MAVYKANPIEVTAQVIKKVTLHEKGMQLDLENGDTFIATPAMTARMTPIPGDYVVTHPDGYEYLNPKDVFEANYEFLMDDPEDEKLDTDPKTDDNLSAGSE